MATGLVVKGFPELRARLSAISRPGAVIGAAWQKETTTRARSTAPARTGRGRASIHPGVVTPERADVRGAFWLIFIDRGTKAHVIEPKTVSGSKRGGPGTAKWLRFEWKGQTIFAKRVHRKRMKRRPFLTQAAQQALAGNTFADEIVKLWNRRGGSFRWRKAA